MYKCIIIILVNFVIATISFVLNVAGDLPQLQAPPQPCSIKRITLIQSDTNNNNNNNKNKNNVNNDNNNNYIIIMIAIIIVIITVIIT